MIDEDGDGYDNDVLVETNRGKPLWINGYSVGADRRFDNYMSKEKANYLYRDHFNTPERMRNAPPLSQWKRDPIEDGGYNRYDADIKSRQTPWIRFVRWMYKLMVETQNFNEMTPFGRGGQFMFMIGRLWREVYLPYVFPGGIPANRDVKNAELRRRLTLLDTNGGNEPECAAVVQTIRESRFYRDITRDAENLLEQRNRNRNE
jgi:hypothetical protein